MKKNKEILILLGCLLLISQIYLYTIFPVFKNDDSPETITSAFTLGIGHPPGYPLYTIAGKVFSMLPAGSPAFRINSFAIFLAMIVLLLSYFIIRQNLCLIFGYENKLLSFLSMFILAFSYIFWNQAIEAKGGIYIMNLLFLTIMLYLSTELIKSFNNKYFYLLSFVFGLSLADHWPSMIILAPVFGYLFFKYRKKFNANNIICVILLLLAGLSPYLYLPIRAMNENVFVFLARPVTWDDFWWTVLRGAYSETPPATAGLYMNQIKEFLLFFINNFSIISVLIFAGGYALFKKNKEIFFYYAAIFFVTTAMVVFYNRTPEEYIWAVDIFLVPLLIISIIFIALGCRYIIDLIKIRKYQYALLLAVMVVTVYLGTKSFRANNERYNYLSYDFGLNELATMEQDSFYIPLGDYYVLPLSYERVVQHKADDIKYATMYNLSHKWGINDFIRKYGNVELQEHSLNRNIGNVMAKYFPASNIYFSYDYTKEMKINTGNLRMKAKGLLFKAAGEKEKIPSGIFKLYSYRGIFDTDNNYDKSLAELYAKKAAKQANDYYDMREYGDAAALFKYALLFPGETLRPDICYYLYLSYKEMGDDGNQVKYLKEAIKANKAYYKAYEMLGLIYFNEQLFLPAKEMFETGIKYGGVSAEPMKYYLDQIGDIDTYSQCKVINEKADGFLNNKKYLQALDLYDVLLEHNYTTAGIYKNIAECYTKENDPEKAALFAAKANDMNRGTTP